MIFHHDSNTVITTTSKAGRLDFGTMYYRGLHHLKIAIAAVLLLYQGAIIEQCPPKIPYSTLAEVKELSEYFIAYYSECLKQSIY